MMNERRRHREAPPCIGSFVYGAHDGWKDYAGIERIHFH